MQKMLEIAATVCSLAGHPFRKMIIPLSLMKNKCWGYLQCQAFWVLNNLCKCL